MLKYNDKIRKIDHNKNSHVKIRLSINIIVFY